MVMRSKLFLACSRKVSRYWPPPHQHPHPACGIPYYIHQFRSKMHCILMLRVFSLRWVLCRMSLTPLSSTISGPIPATATYYEDMSRGGGGRGAARAGRRGRAAAGGRGARGGGEAGGL